MNHIKKIIKAIGEEPLELLRNVEKQVIGEELKPNADPEIPQDESNYKKQVAEQDGRRLQALESELKDIRRQKEVLKAQTEEADKARDSQPVINQLPELSLKRGRKMGGGQKGVAKKETTRVEKPVPPSG